jgi:hypothetical protein
MLKRILLLLIPLAFTCSNPVAPEKVVDTNTYIAGVIRKENLYTACLWHAGMRTDLISSTLLFINNAKLINDIFLIVGSYESGDKSIACYWKNNNRVDLQGQYGTTANDIEISNGEVYVVGNFFNGKNDIACLWQNTILVDSFVNSNSNAKAICINENNIYIAGTFDSYNKEYACYWLNGRFSQLDTLPSIAKGIIKKSDNLYISGSCEIGGHMRACIWINNVRYILDNSNYSDIKSIFLVEDSLFSLGYYQKGNNIISCYWKLFDKYQFNQSVFVNSLIKDGSSLSYCGFTGLPQASKAVYWINGYIHELHPAGFDESWCSVICIRP